MLKTSRKLAYMNQIERKTERKNSGEKNKEIGDY